MHESIARGFIYEVILQFLSFEVWPIIRAMFQQTNNYIYNDDPAKFAALTFFPL